MVTMVECESMSNVKSDGGGGGECQKPLFISFSLHAALSCSAVCCRTPKRNARGTVLTTCETGYSMFRPQKSIPTTGASHPGQLSPEHVVILQVRFSSSTPSKRKTRANRRFGSCRFVNPELLQGE